MYVCGISSIDTSLRERNIAKVLIINGDQERAEGQEEEDARNLIVVVRLAGGSISNCQFGSSTSIATTDTSPFKAETTRFSRMPVNGEEYTHVHAG